MVGMCFAPRVWDEVGMEMEWGWSETRDGVEVEVPVIKALFLPPTF